MRQPTLEVPRSARDDRRPTPFPGLPAFRLSNSPSFRLLSPERNPPLPIPRLPPLRLHPGVAELLGPADPLLGGQAFEDELAGGDDAVVVAPGREAELHHRLYEARDHAEALEAELGALVARDLEGAALVEPGDDLPQLRAAHPLLEHLAGGAADQLARDGVAAL